jgi:hypothetical protein
VKHIPVSLAVEGVLDEAVLRQLLLQCGRQFAVGACYGKRGKDYLRQNVTRFSHAAAYKPFIILTDLDEEDCPPGMLKHWLPQGHHANLVLRIAVRAVESWLLADRDHLAEFMGIAGVAIPQWPDNQRDPKSLLVDLARRSRRRDIREDLVPVPGSTSKVGKNYVGRLIQFVGNAWRVDTATRQRSASLDRAIRALQLFMPAFPGDARS